MSYTSPYGPRELVLNDEGSWVPRVREEASDVSAEDEYFETGEPTVTDLFDAAGLTAKQRYVLDLRHGLRDGKVYTLQQIAEAMGINRSSVYRIETAGKKKLERLLFK